MINIFKENKIKKSSKKSRRKKSDSAIKEKLARLNPMAFGLLAIKNQDNPNNDFISSSFRAISEKPELLTDKWVDSINKFVDSVSKSICLDPPEVKEGDRVGFDSLVVSKVIEAKMDAAYPMPALLCSDSRGWKFYFKTSKAFNYNVGDTISLVATVSSHKEGITFLRRPSKLSCSNQSI